MVLLGGFLIGAIMFAPGGAAVGWLVTRLLRTDTLIGAFAGALVSTNVGIYLVARGSDDGPWNVGVLFGLVGAVVAMATRITVGLRSIRSPERTAAQRCEPGPAAASPSDPPSAG